MACILLQSYRNRVLFCTVKIYYKWSCEKPESVSVWVAISIPMSVWWSNIALLFTSHEQQQTYEDYYDSIHTLRSRHRLNAQKT